MEELESIESIPVAEEMPEDNTITEFYSTNTIQDILAR